MLLSLACSLLAVLLTKIAALNKNETALETTFSVQIYIISDSDASNVKSSIALADSLLGASVEPLRLSVSVRVATKTSVPIK
jgi:hypothetical protein